MEDILQQLKVGLHVEADDLIDEIERNREAIAELVAVMHEARNVLSFLKPKTFGYGTLNRLDGAIAKHTQPTKKGSS